MEMISQEPPTELFGSHHVTMGNGRAVIHGLEVFSGYDEDFDSRRPKDDEIRKWTPENVQELARVTQSMIEDRRLHPQIIIRHTPDQADSLPTSEHNTVGRLSRVWFEDRGGVPYVVADADMPAAEFEQLILSNRFPRRSAQIYESDMQLSEVSLLGREAPNRPLPDTHFSKTRHSIRFDRTLPELNVAHPGPSNTPRGIEMPEKTDDYKSELEELQKKYAKLEEENEELRKAAKSSKNEKDEDNREREDNSKEITRIRSDYTKQIEDLKKDLECERHARLVQQAERSIDSLETEGYNFGDARSDVVDDLVTSEDMGKRLDFYKRLVHQSPINRRVVDFSKHNIDIDANGGDAKVADLARKARQYAKGDADKFRKFMDSGGNPTD